MNVLSLFDGMSCGQIALNRVGIVYDTYFAAEIDPYAIKVTKHNYPNTVHLGDVTAITGDSLPKIDLLIGGSPCQGFSNAGKHLNFEDPRSKLFFNYVKLLEELKPTYFLLENVVMKKEWEEVITSYMDVKPVMINSALVSAQNRRRLYWTNIPFDTNIEDKGIFFKDIKEHDVQDKALYYGEGAWRWIRSHEERKGKKLRIIGDMDKLQMLEASMYKKYSAQRFFGIPDTEGVRYISPLECERAQTVPDNYTAFVSKTQRYKMLGNGWTVDVICRIFEGLK